MEDGKPICPRCKSEHIDKLKTQEDLGRITCGNAILSGSLPLVEYQELEGGIST